MSTQPAIVLRRRLRGALADQDVEMRAVLLPSPPAGQVLVRVKEAVCCALSQVGAFLEKVWSESSNRRVAVLCKEISSWPAIGALTAIVIVLGSWQAMAKEKLTYAYQIDPMFEALLWGIKNGKVTSDLIELDASPLAIPALIQATPTKRYDVVQSDVIGVPRSAERGLELRILSTAIRYRPEGDAHIIFTPKDSSVQSVQDLKGKKIAVTSLGSTGFHNLRFALGEGFGVNVDITGGDFIWVELPPAAMFGALSQNRVDAASLSLTHTYRAKVGGEFKQAVAAGRKMYELFQLQMISSVNVGYPEKLDARPEPYREFNRILKASADYMHAHADEVYASVGKTYNVDPDVFRGLQASLAEFPAALEQKDLAALAKEWELAHKYKLLTSVPKVERFIWSGVIVQK